ncbi:MAG: GHKL domain-containing protein [Saprospiraceae bacterium]|nr:GHKL domain-containing protein [Saprospiraceae bacterium]
MEQKTSHIESQNKVLERTNQMLEEFAYVVAHDLREPLRSIISFTNLLEKTNGHRFDENAKTYMDFIVKSGKHMNNLLVDLLQYTTIDKNEIEKHEVNVNEIVSDINFLLSAAIEQTNAVIIFNDLPNVYANDTHIKQLFQQLIHNAMKFIKKDISPIIRISCIEKESYFHFSVQDNGIGIGADYLDKIFKIFNRLDKKNYQGTGIGLAICQKIARMYGGKIWVESVEGEGSTFHFTIEKAK